jgi:hypothetical protein
MVFAAIVLGNFLARRAIVFLPQWGAGGEMRSSAHLFQPVMLKTLARNMEGAGSRGT